MHSTSVFYHIPKYGGTSIGENAKLNMGCSQVYSVYEKNPLENLYVLNNFDGTKRIRLIKTHVPYGSVAALKPYASFVILREPERRLVSLMQDIGARPTHYLFEVSGGDSFDVASFLESAPPYESDNVLVRYLIGRKGFSKQRVDSGDLEEAIHNLTDNLSWFGIQEDFESTLSILAKELGLKFVTKVRKNEAKRKIEMTEGLRDAMRPYVKYDRQFYEVARNELKKRAASDRTAPAIPHIENRFVLSVLKIISKFR